MRQLNPQNSFLLIIRCYCNRLDVKKIVLHSYTTTFDFVLLFFYRNSQQEKSKKGSSLHSRLNTVSLMEEEATITDWLNSSRDVDAE